VFNWGDIGNEGTKERIATYFNSSSTRDLDNRMGPKRSAKKTKTENPNATPTELLISEQKTLLLNYLNLQFYSFFWPICIRIH